MKAKFTDTAEGEITNRSEMLSGFSIGSRWNFECYDKHGNLKWEERDRPNICTNEGLDKLLNVMFDNVAAIATWYVALVNTNTAAAATMTYATPVYTEDTDYDEAVRQTFDGTVSSQAITNSASKATFTITTGGQTLYGASLVSSNVKGNTAAAGAVLFCYSLFSSGKAMDSGDTFKVQISIAAAHA
jgi:hypothetical protein